MAPQVDTGATGGYRRFAFDNGNGDEGAYRRSRCVAVAVAVQGFLRKCISN